MASSANPQAMPLDTPPVLFLAGDGTSLPLHAMVSRRQTKRVVEAGPDVAAIQDAQGEQYVEQGSNGASIHPIPEPLACF